MHLDTTAARAVSGVVAVITAAEIGDPVPTIPLRLIPLDDLVPYEQPVIANGKVRYVGEPIAVVVAETAAIAEDALELIAVEIETLPPCVDTRDRRSQPVAAVRGDGHQPGVDLHGRPW